VWELGLIIAAWVDRKQVQKPEGIVEALATVAGEREAKSVLEQAGTPEVKKRLLENADEAFAS
jgi:2-hydroxychromene-2-carboxylate isomerase